MTRARESCAGLSTLFPIRANLVTKPGRKMRGNMPGRRTRGLDFLWMWSAVWFLFPLGSAVYDFYGADRPGDNLFASSLVVLKADTGERVWHFQNSRHDIWSAGVRPCTLADSGSGSLRVLPFSPSQKYSVSRNSPPARSSRWSPSGPSNTMARTTHPTHCLRTRVSQCSPPRRAATAARCADSRSGQRALAGIGAEQDAVVAPPGDVGLGFLEGKPADRMSVALSNSRTTTASPPPRDSRIR